LHARCEMGGDAAALQQQLDSAIERNEQLQLENLRFRSNGPKLHKLAVRFSSSLHTLRGGVSTNLRQLGAALACDYAVLSKAVCAVDAATRARDSASEAERGRLAGRGWELEEELKESQAAVQVLEGRLEALTADLERKVDAHRELKETFKEECARAEELQQEAESWKRNSAVKDERIACLEQAQGALTAQLHEAKKAVEKERSNASEYQKALSELERTNAVLACKKSSLEQEVQRSRDSASKDVAAACRQSEEAREAAEQARSKAQAAALRVAEQDVLVATLRKDIDHASHRMREMELRHAEENRAGEHGEVAQRRVVELERQASKQRASHKQRLEELQRYYDKELAKVRGEGESAGRAAAEAAAARERQLKEAAANELAQSTRTLKEEVLALKVQLAATEKEASTKVAAAERDAQAELAAKESALQRLAETRNREGSLRAETEALQLQRSALQQQLEALSRAKDEMNARQESEMGPLVATMESSLKNLSARLRAKEEEVAALKSTVQKECQERTALMAELMSYRAGDGAAANAGGGHHFEEHRRSFAAETDVEDEASMSQRAPSCPPSVGYKGDRGWGLLPNIARGPSPAQIYDARLTKERINYGGRLKRL
jgi:chromosome segregation ATPase